jgi:hypothetical protein
MSKIALAAAFIGLGLAAPQSDAAALFSFKTPLSQYTITPGATVSVDIYLQETLTEGTPSELLQYQGLIGAGIRIDTLSVPSSPNSASYLADLSQFIPSSEFMGGTGATPYFLSQPFSPSVVSPAYLLEFVDFDQDGITGDAISSTLRQVYLGTLHLTAGSGGETVFQATTINASSQDFVFAAGNPDPVVISAIAPARFTLSVVPEPVMFLPLLATTLLLIRRKTRE